MHDTLLIGGKEYRPNPFAGRSSFYQDYTFQLSHPGPLEVSQAIGAVRKADIPALPERAGLLREAAAKFNYSNADVEHCVRMTGMPLRLVAGLFDQVPAIFHEVPERMGARFHSIGKQDPRLAETIGQGLYRVLAPPDGFCYAITPGNDPRAAAIVAANLAYLGFPFILRASIRDTAAPLIIRALIAANKAKLDLDFKLATAIDLAGRNVTGGTLRLAVEGATGPDTDRDGIPDAVDAFPFDPNETVDTDDDGTGDNADRDDDGDGVSDVDDEFPLDPTESLDTDDDGTGNTADIDDDSDGVSDVTDAFPLDPTETRDSDGDGVGDNADPDTPDDRNTGPRATGGLCGGSMVGAMLLIVAGLACLRSGPCRPSARAGNDG